jgi:hypothetical protein
MGWLEDLAKERRYKSLRAVAQAMCKSPSWPADDDRSPETVANKLRDADKGKYLDSWTSTAGRPLLRVLAEVLQEDEAELIERLQDASSRVAGGAGLRPFKMFPALRAIDLHTEDLFPGIPVAIAVAGGPRAARTWWVAPAGAGKTLVADWLKLKHGWAVLHANRWADVVLPDRGRLFVELDSVDDISVEALRAIPKDLRICVAAPRLPPSPPSSDPNGQKQGGSGLDASTAAVLPSDFQQVRTQPPRTWVSELIGWAAARVKPGGGFDVERVRKMFRDERLVDLFETPGNLLEFLGMVDHVGVDDVEAARRSKDLLGWIGVWLRAALERPDRQRMVGIADLLGKRGPQILVQMEIERLRRDLGSSLPDSVWVELVPRGHAPDVDRDRLLTILEQGGPEAIAQARAMLAPDAAAVVQGLKAIGALAEIDGSHLALRPAWIANVITNAAIAQLDDDVPDGLGTLLLFKGTSEAALRRMIEEVRAGKLERIQACVANVSAATPERMAALNGAFRAVGLALLAGASVPRELLQTAWDRQMAHLFQRSEDQPPVPVLSVAAQDYWKGTTAPSAWFGAALAISRTLFDAGGDVRPSVLNPWGVLPEVPSERSACTEALLQAASAFRPDDEEVASRDPFRRGLYRLGGDLLDRRGIVRRSGRLLVIQCPDLLVMLAIGARFEIDEAARREIVRLPFGLEPLEDACRRRKVALADVLAWCWSIWQSDRREHWPPTEWARGANLQGAKRLWASVPVSDLSENLCDQLTRLPQIWPYLPEQVWARWLDVWCKRESHSDHGAAVFRFIPDNLVLRSVSVWGSDPWCRDIRRIVWGRMPQALLELLDQLATSPTTPHPERKHEHDPALRIFYDAPDEHIQPLIDRARIWISAPARFPGGGEWLRGWLLRVVEQRSPGWREAYELLATSLAESQLRS